MSPIPVRNVIDELQQAIEDLVADDVDLGHDVYLLRWLKVNDLNVKKAERSIRAAVKWRKDNGINELVNQERHPELVKLIPFVLGGKCRDGTPMNTFKAGNMDLHGIICKYGKEVVYRYFAHSFAQFEAANLQWNKDNWDNRKNKDECIDVNSVKGDVVIYDLKDVPYGQISSFKCVRLASQICMDYANYYPSLGSHTIIINCNKFATAFINIMKPIIQSPHLKIDVYDTNENKWKPALHNQIDPAELVPSLGGTRIVK